MMAHVIGFGVRSISKGIAVASEALAARKTKSSQDNSQDPRVDSGESDSERDDEQDVINQEWELDEAVTDILPGYEESNTAHAEQLSAQPIVPQTSEARIQPLPQPVILPQRRPGTRSRGFIRAYAPSLSEYSNLDQTTFLDFLNEFDKASKASPIFDVINIACFGIGLVPSTICFAVSTSVITASKFAQEIQTRYRSNKFLDNINESLFEPRGLYCMVMAYRPDLPNDAFLRADVSDDAHGVALQKVLGKEDSGLRQKLAQLRVSSGIVRNDLQIPTPAPLVYPALDRAIEAATTATQSDSLTAASTQSNSHGVMTTTTANETANHSNTTTLQKSPASDSPLAKLSAIANNPVVQDYLDRRAQTDFLSKNPSSKLATTLPPQKQYVNRFADPNHRVNSGSLFGLLSGGTFDPIASGRVRRAERRARRKGEMALSQAEKHDAYMGRKVRGRATGTASKKVPIVGRIIGLKKDILYLVVVNLPGQDDVQTLLAD